MEHSAAYFEPWENPVDGQTYYTYNSKYFEQNRPNHDWQQSPDLFTENCPPEIQSILTGLTDGAKKEKKEKEGKK